MKLQLAVRKCRGKGQCLSFPDPPIRCAACEWRGEGGPWVLRLPWKQPIFRSAAVLEVERETVQAEA